MRQLYTQRLFSVLAVLLLTVTLLSHACYSQEKLTSTPKLPSRPVDPMIYFQRITQDRTPITKQSGDYPDSPRFIQKFSQSNTALLPQRQASTFPVRRLDQEPQKNALPVLKSGKQEMSRMAVLSCDDAPIGTNDLYVMGNDKALSIAAPGFLVNDIDLQGEALTATVIVDQVDHGTLAAFSNGSFTYIPTAGFTGTDQFQYRMRDASLNESAAITVTIDVQVSGNRAPVGTNDLFSALAGTTLSITAPGFLANDIDQDGDVLTATVIVDQVDHGTLAAFADGSFTYIPTAGFTGTDQFQYKMRDSEFNSSEVITVSIQVYEGNRNPIGTNNIFGVVQNTARSIPPPGFLSNDIDPDGDVLTATVIVDQVDHGTLAAFADGSFTYIPTSGFTGTDQFQYKMRDSKFNSSQEITVTLQVIGSGVLPFGFDDHYKTSDGIALSVAAPGFLLNDIDQDGEAITATVIVDQVDHGTLAAFADGSFTYIPTPGFVGTDQFQYKMKDASNNQSEAITVTIEVVASYNRNPVGRDDEFAAVTNTTLAIASPGILRNDIDQDEETITATVIVDQVDHGTLAAFSNGSFTYVPNPGFVGTDQFKYRMRDASFNVSEDITVTIHVYEGNRNPSGTNDVYAVVKDTPLTIAAGGFLVNDYDPDGDALTATVIVDQVDHGTLAAFSNGSFTYTPTAGFTGTDQFQYKMQDSKSNSSGPVTVILEVVGPNLPPIASANNITTECTGPSGTTVTLNGTNSSDPESGALTFTWYENNSIVAGPTSIGISDVSFSTGVHQVKLKVEDECGLTSETNITVTIQDLAGPLVSATLIPTGAPHKYTVSCAASDVCSQIVSSSSHILIPGLTNPSVSLKNKKNGYSLDIDQDKNTVSVQAPDAAAFWAMILSNGGIAVQEGQVIDALYDKNKYKFTFDSNGNLQSVKGSVVTLRCTATDGNGNTGVSETSLPMGAVMSLSETSSLSDPDKSSMLHQNYPNPFSDITTIRYLLNAPAFVRIAIYDQAGHQVEEIVPGQMPAGEHESTWDATQRNSGIYYYRIQYNGKQVVDKMLHLRP
jgi:hypothetical protein